MRTAAIIAGFIGLLIALWFLGWLVVSIGALPLYIVIVAVLGMMTFDFYQSIKEDETQDNGG